MKKIYFKRMFSLVLLAFLSACGGSADDESGVALCADGTTTKSAGKQGACSHHGGLAVTPTPVPKPTVVPTPAPVPVVGSSAGLWLGKTTENRSITSLVLNDGTFYNFYSVAGNPNKIAGVVQGAGTASNGTFQSNNAKDFNLEGYGILPAFVSASYTVKSAFSGTVAYSDSRFGVTSFTSSYDRDYETKPNLTNIAGVFSGVVSTSSGNELATVNISAAGVITGSGISTCSISGTVTPRPDGNVYDMVIKFGGSPCLFANQSLTGISYFNSSIKRLYAAAPNSSRTDGVVFVGTKF
ncbi:hypothetical protein [Iodobacter fluviatilis]|uniref:Transferrin-binding protein B C-lobe/N-lobe beta barrel domain-containing protein n=1 Tax=Iodobacter fluviatilis TaxID=537 RepID=A0A7G3G7B7_9NEIS|nr:hypothetical protein [Iodobacter fluviatilis]QBC43084.1 hypothetical protein C1H71_05650 [Iodobacter fluviatilis]